MIRSLYSAASGMTAQQLNVDNIAHNLANANTVGFKARRAQFQDLLYHSMVQPGAAAGSQTSPLVSSKKRLEQQGKRPCPPNFKVSTTRTRCPCSRSMGTRVDPT